MDRPDWNTYFMDFAHLACQRSTCLRRKVGAVLVKDKQILASGYNGQPKGLTHCDKTGCLREKMSIPSGQRQELCRGLHAEQNAIIQAAYHGTPINGSVLYCTTYPCSICMKMIINAGIKEVYYKEYYNDELSESLAKDAGLDMCQF